MTGRELTKLLHLSGVGKIKVDICIGFLTKKSNDTAEKLLAYLEQRHKDGEGIPEGTIEKARAIYAGIWRWPINPELAGKDTDRDINKDPIYAAAKKIDPRIKAEDHMEIQSLDKIDFEIDQYANYEDENEEGPPRRLPEPSIAHDNKPSRKQAQVQ